MENWFYCNSIVLHYIATSSCTCHDSITVVSCAIFHSNHFTTIWKRAKWNLHPIWKLRSKIIRERRPRMWNHDEFRSESLQPAIFQCSWWRHQIETFSALLALCQEDSPSKGQWWVAPMFSYICAWTNNWANSWDTVDLRRHRSHYDVTVIPQKGLIWRCIIDLHVCSLSRIHHFFLCRR